MQGGHEKSCVLVAIGDELLSGVRREANCSWLAWHLNNSGWNLEAVEIVPDIEEQIHDAFNRWLGRVPLMVFCGGLGPTHDDRTRDAIAHYLGCALRADPLYERVLARYPVDSELRERFEKSRDTQSMVPEASRALYNPEGSALGIEFTRNGTRVLALPGVPLEYRAMVRQELPDLFKAAECWSSVMILGQPETKVVAKIPEVIEDKNLHVSVLPAFPTVELIIRGESSRVSKADALVRSRFEDVLPPDCADSDGYASLTRTLATAVLHQCQIRSATNADKKNVTLVCAESCTGGLVQGALTAIPGSSEFFKGGVVTYTDVAKQKIIAVPPSILETFGAVSPECAEAMASGVLMLYNADFAVSVTGIAGPDGGTPETPVGGVWFGLAARGSTGRAKTASFHRLIRGERNEVRDRAVNFALAELWRTIRDGAPAPILGV